MALHMVLLRCAAATGSVQGASLRATDMNLRLQALRLATPPPVLPHRSRLLSIRASEDDESPPSYPPGYVPPIVWEYNEQEGVMGAVNRPTAGARSNKHLPVGRHQLQLYSLGTPNGVKVTILLEELNEARKMRAPTLHATIYARDTLRVSSTFLVLASTAHDVKSRLCCPSSPYESSTAHWQQTSISTAYSACLAIASCSYACRVCQLATQALGLEYDAWKISIFDLDQFGSGFVKVNPNSKIPAMMDYAHEPPIRIFESGNILKYVAERHEMFIPTGLREKTECFNWLFWQARRHLVQLQSIPCQLLCASH
eukprot:2718094-Pleurochrysis_carterae.AAC.1